MNLMTDLKDKLLATMSRFAMIAPGDKVMVAVSGGVDSVVLLDILLELKEDLRIELSIFHLDHQLRGEESRADADFVSALANESGLSTISDSFDVASFAKERGLSIEEAARVARYDHMERAVKEIGANKVALGHTADDRVETFFINLIRGSGLKGLSSIPPKRGVFIRPLIEVKKAEVEAYAKERGLKFRIDSSNLDPAFLRNRVRAELIPLLETYNPNIREVVLGNIEMIMADEAFLAEMAAFEFDRMAILNEGMVEIPLGELEGLSDSLRARVIRKAIAALKGDLTAIEKRHTEGIFEPKEASLKRELPGGIVIMKEHDSLLVLRKDFLKEGEDIEFPLGAEGGSTACGLGFEFKSSIIMVEAGKSPLSLIAQGELPSEGSHLAHFDADLIEDPLTIRNWRFGDRFKPLKMGGFKKVSDLFVDAKIAKRLKRRIPIVTSGGQIIWVVGLRLDDRYKVTEDTERVLKLEAVPKK